MPLDLDRDLDVKLLVRWLGADGAKAGLLASRECSLSILQGVAARLGLDVRKDLNRRNLIDEIVRAANRRVDKTIDELCKMNHDQLVEYFENIDVSREELLLLLQSLDLGPRKESRRSLVEFAARELSETGRYVRIASPTPRDHTSGATKRVKDDEDRK